MSKHNLNGLNTGTVGAIAELVISAELMRNGYEVYRALSSHCRCDILAVKNGVVNEIEIRSGLYYNRKDGGITLHYPTRRSEGKKMIIYTHSDNKIHYINPLDDGTA